MKDKIADVVQLRKKRLSRKKKRKWVSLTMTSLPNSRRRTRIFHKLKAESTIKSIPSNFRQTTKKNSVSVRLTTNSREGTPTPKEEVKVLTFLASRPP